MGGGSSSPPPVQNPNITAATQQGYNTQAGQSSQSGTALSENQQNWLGSLGVHQTGVDQFGNPIYASSLTLSPAQQNLYDILTGTQGLAGRQGQSLINNANYGGQNPADVIGNESSGLTNQMMSQWLDSQGPWMQKQEQQLDTQLRNQGLGPSPTATADPSTWGPYEQQMNQLRQAQQMGVSGAAAQFEPTAFGQAESMYTLPAQLGLQLAQFGQYTSPGNALVQTPGLNIAPADYTGAVNAAQQQAFNEWQTQQQINAQMMSGIFGMAGNIAGGALAGGAARSDRALKTNIELLATRPDGVNIYRFNIAGVKEPQVGFIADEVEQVYPDAVTSDLGYKHINYDMVVR